MGEDSPTYSLNDARESYERARAADSSDPETFESLDYFFDAVDEQLELAEKMFRRAIELGAGSWAGLGRVLAQTGLREEALALLAPDTCPHAHDREVVNVRQEVNEGRGATGR